MSKGDTSANAPARAAPPSGRNPQAVSGTASIPIAVEIAKALQNAAKRIERDAKKARDEALSAGGISGMLHAAEAGALMKVAVALMQTTADVLGIETEKSK